jgi:outer membrane protein assembly factor BamD (BamD/ComL family)
MTDFEKYLEQAVLWVRTHQERFWAITGTAFLAVLFIALLVHHQQIESDEAWTQLGALQGQLSQGRFDDARKGLEAWETRFRGTGASTYEKFVRADLMYRTSDYVQASQIYGDLSQTGRPESTRPLALSAQITSEEMAGQVQQAQSLTQTFLDRYPDHFLAAPTYMTQARLAELAGNPAAAAAVYDRVVLLYPQSPWTALAKARSQTLSKK